MRSATLGRGGGRLQADLRSGLERGLGLNGGVGLERTHLAVVAVMVAEMLAMMLDHLGIGVQRGGLGLSRGGLNRLAPDGLGVSRLDGSLGLRGLDDWCVRSGLGGFSRKYRRSQNGNRKQGGGNCFQHGHLLFEGDREVAGRTAGLVDHADNIREPALNAP